MTRREYPVPARVRKLADQVAADHGRKPPRIEVVAGQGNGVSWKSANRIRLRVARQDGTLVVDWRDLQILLLHEMAHLIAPERENHGRRFYDIFWGLIRRYRADAERALLIEATYMRGSLRRAVLAEIPGAQAALDFYQREVNLGTPKQRAWREMLLLMLRRYRKAPAAVAATASASAPSPVAAGRDLPVGTVMVATYKGARYELTVGRGPDGSPSYEHAGKSYRSPSAAGTAVTGTSVNGWKFWRV